MPFPLHFPFGGTLSTVWSPLSSTPWPPNIDCQEHGNSTNQKEGTNCKNQKRLLNVKCEIHGRRSRTSIIDSTTWNSSSSSNGSRRQLQNCTVGNGFVQRKPQYTHTFTFFDKRTPINKLCSYQYRYQYNSYYCCCCFCWATIRLESREEKWGKGTFWSRFRLDRCCRLGKCVRVRE